MTIGNHLASTHFGSNTTSAPSRLNRSTPSSSSQVCAQHLNQDVFFGKRPQMSPDAKKDLNHAGAGWLGAFAGGGLGVAVISVLSHTGILQAINNLNHDLGTVLILLLLGGPTLFLGLKAQNRMAQRQSNIDAGAS